MWDQVSHHAELISSFVSKRFSGEKRRYDFIYTVTRFQENNTYTAIGTVNIQNRTLLHWQTQIKAKLTIVI
jgi:hypothetical protein